MSGMKFNSSEFMRKGMAAGKKMAKDHAQKKANELKKPVKFIWGENGPSEIVYPVGWDHDNDKMSDE